MTDTRKPHVDRPLAPAPGLQLLGADAEVGLCVDGVCTLPGVPGVTAPAEKTD